MEDVLAACGLDGRAACRAQSSVVLVPQDAHPSLGGGIFGQNLPQTVDTAVRRGVVDEDELRVDVALYQKRAGAGGDITFHPVDGDEHRDGGRMLRVCIHILANVANFR